MSDIATNCETLDTVTAKRRDPDPTTVQVNLRLSAELVERIEAFGAGVAETVPGLEVTRTDAIKMLLTRALDAQPTADGGRRRR